MECYLDNSATTRCLDSAAALMAGILCTDYGNPSSLHHKGVQAEEYVRHAREVIAKTLKVTPKEIFFTSGGTEQGFEVTYLPVDENGKIRLSDLEAAIRPDTILVSIMHTNNEIGALEPIAEAGELIKRVNPNTLFHVDAVQGYGKAKILPKRMKIDMLSVSGHKIHGPKGIGFLYVGDRVKIRPIVFGGGQERGLRSGTENVPAIAGMGKAAEEMYQNLDTDLDRMYALKQRLADGISTMENVRINGLCGRDSAPHVLSVSFAGVRSEVLLHALEEREIYVSAGSACASNHPDTAGSATLRAIGLPKELLNSTIRFSLSVFTTEEEIDYTVQVLHELVPMLRRFTRR